ncbi:MAG: amidohydrolase family protein [Bacteroidia bacterium]|nr:amidohydrolase family protein [Bacteroidia bacterium]
MLKIDAHSHILPEHLPRFSEKFGYGDFIHLDHHKPGFANMMKGNVFFREIETNCWDPAIRLEEYALRQTQVQVVCTVPIMFSYWAKPKDTLELSRFLNDHIAEVVAADPRHFVGLGTVPMQDADLAVKELHRLKQLGLPGIQIGSNINDINLSEPQFYPIWEACEALNMAVMVHPWNMMGKNLMERYWLPWLVGMPAETSRAICSMIFGGVFEKFTQLRVMFSHASGSFLSTFGRVEHGFNCRPDLVAIDNPIPPREYLGRFWVDSITHDTTMLRYVMNMVGSNRVMIGSDYPFPLGDLSIGKLVDEMGLPPFDKENIYYRSALEWLGLEKGKFV